MAVWGRGGWPNSPTLIVSTVFRHHRRLLPSVNNQLWANDHRFHIPISDILT